MGTDCNIENIIITNARLIHYRKHNNKNKYLP